MIVAWTASTGWRIRVMTARLASVPSGMFLAAVLGGILAELHRMDGLYEVAQTLGTVLHEMLAGTTI